MLWFFFGGGEEIKVLEFFQPAANSLLGTCVVEVLTFSSIIHKKQGADCDLTPLWPETDAAKVYASWYTYKVSTWVL